MEFMATVFDALKKFFSVYRITDVIDIFLVTFILYKGIKLVRETRAGQLVKGIAVLVLLTLFSSWLQFNTINYILRNTLQVGVVALLVVFQPELRRALEKIGRSNISRLFNVMDDEALIMIDEVCRAAQSLSLDKVGALIVIERDTKLGDIVDTGTYIGAKVSAELLVNIFIPNTPLHDGAVIINNDRIEAAACILPLTQNDYLSRELGTRHRAALGVTENSDAVVVVVSEETGKISLAYNGDMARSLSGNSLRDALIKYLSNDSQKEEIKNWKERFKWVKK